MCVPLAVYFFRLFSSYLTISKFSYFSLVLLVDLLPIFFSFLFIIIIVIVAILYYMLLFFFLPGYVNFLY